MSELIVEDILAPIVRHLRADPILKQLQSTIPPGGVNPLLGPPTSVLREDRGLTDYTGDPAPWIFRSFSDTGEPYAHVEGTGSCSITLEHIQSWSRQPRGKSVFFPIIEVYYHCDPTRDAIGHPVKYDAKDKCLTLHKRLTQIFNIRDKGVGGFLMWGPKKSGEGALRVISSVPGDDLRATPLFQGDGLIVGKASFEMEVMY